MKRVRLVVALVAVSGVLSSCAGESAETSAASSTTSTVVVSTTETPTTAAPDGPCLDADDHLVVDSTVSVAGEAASFGYATYSHCPWIETTRSDIAADGFFHDLDQVRVEAEPSGTILIEAPGYPGANLSGGWLIEFTDESQVAAMSAAGEGRWEVAVPDHAAVYRLGLSLKWSTGSAAYAAIVVVGDPAENALVAITPDHDVAIHPTLLPENLAACDAGEDVLLFCDPNVDYIWLELDVRPTSSLFIEYSSPDPFVPGALDLGGPPQAENLGILLSADEILTVSSSGIDTDTVYQILATIPAFDPVARDTACGELDPVELIDYTWMCDLVVSVDGEMGEDDLRELAGVMGNADVLYQFHVVLPGTWMDDWVLVYPRETLDGELAAWRSKILDAAEEVGYDPGLLDDPGSRFDHVMVQPQPDLSSEHWVTIVKRLETAGFNVDLELRQGQWYGND